MRKGGWGLCGRGWLENCEGAGGGQGSVHQGAMGLQNGLEGMQVLHLHVACVHGMFIRRGAALQSIHIPFCFVAGW